MKIIIDTREKEPWSFDFWSCRCIKKKLDYGDYSIEGLENTILLERKKSVGEIAINLGKKREQFFREIDGLAAVDHPYLICEFPREYLDQFPYNSGIPKKNWPYLRMNKGFIISSFNKIEEAGITILFSSSKGDANQIAYEILNNVYTQR